MRTPETLGNISMYYKLTLYESPMTITTFCRLYHLCPERYQNEPTKHTCIYTKMTSSTTTAIYSTNSRPMMYWMPPMAVQTHQTLLKPIWCHLTIICASIRSPSHVLTLTIDICAFIHVTMNSNLSLYNSHVHTRILISSR